MHRVVLFVPDGVFLLDLGVISHAFEDSPEGGYQLRYASLNGKTVESSHRLEMRTHGGAELIEHADTVVIPAFTSVNRSVGRPVLAALKRARKAGARIVGLDTGAFVVAEAGLLDGGSAAVAPAWSALFAARFPQVEVNSGALFEESSGVSTTSGTQGTVALLRYLIRRDLDLVSVRLLASVDDELPESASLAALREWMMNNLESPLPLSELAARVHMSQRTLIRRFRAETGLSPRQWILARRIDTARELLEFTDDTVEQIAKRVGFSGAAALRDHFKRFAGVTPGEFRSATRVRAGGEGSPRYAQQ